MEREVEVDIGGGGDNLPPPPEDKMKISSPSYCGDLLLDEGYNDDDEDQEFQLRTGGNSDKSSSSILLSQKTFSYKKDTTADDSDSIPSWEEIALLPLHRPTLSWDKIEVPIPYRFHEDHAKLARGAQHSTRPCKKDDFLFLQDTVDMAWRLDPSIELKQLIPTLVPREEYISAAFHLLAGRSSSVFTLDKKKSEVLMLNEGIVIKGITPCALKNYSQQLVECGNIVRKLRKRTERAGCFLSLIDNAFAKFVENYLDIYETILMVKKREGMMGFGELMGFVEPFHTQLQIVDRIWCEEGDQRGMMMTSSTAVELLTHLNHLMLSECSPHVLDLIQNVFITCATVYIKFVSDWIFRGKLPQTRLDFHIQRTRECTYADRRYWVKQFIALTPVPEFLKDSADLVFQTGKSVNLLKQIQKEKVFSSTDYYLGLEEDIQLHFAFSFEELDGVLQYWNGILQNFKSSKDKIIRQVDEAIKEFQMAAGLKHEETLLKTPSSEESIIEKIGLKEIKRRKQQEYRRSLDLQIAEAEIGRKKKLQESEAQDQKDMEYQCMRENRDLEEKKRLRLKHFGDDNVSDNVRGFYQRMHSGSGCSRSPSLENLRLNQEKVIVVTKEKCQEMIGEIGAGDAPDYSSVAVESNNVLQLLQEEGQEDIGGTSVPHHDEIINQDDGEAASLELDDEKLDPDKIITTKPPSYPTSHLKLDYVASADEFMQLSSSSSLQPTTPPQCVTKDPQCLTTFFSQSILIPSKIQNEIVNLFLLHFFLHEKKLLLHLEALHNFLCLQNGMFGRILTERFIDLVEKEKFTTIQNVPVGRLNEILGEAVSISVEGEEALEFASNLAFSLEEVRSPSNASIYQVLNNIKLTYKVTWPINITVTDELLRHFERVFIFQMKLARCELLLERVYVTLKNKISNDALRLYFHRTRFLHFVKCVRNYVNLTVIQANWNKFVAGFDKIGSWDTVYDATVKHIKSVQTSCLLGPKAEPMMNMISNILTVIEIFCQDVDKLRKNGGFSTNIPENEMGQLTKKFEAFETLGKHFITVAYKLVGKGHYPLVSDFLEMYDFNGYFRRENERLMNTVIKEEQTKEQIAAFQ